MSGVEVSRVSDDHIYILAGLFQWWYGYGLRFRTRLCRSVHSESFFQKVHTEMQLNLAPSKLADVWMNRWFAKGKNTPIVDSYLREHFADLLEVKALHNWKPRLLWQQLALIILFDQVPRNIFRGSARAYHYDSIARHLVLSFMTSSTIQDLPYQNICTLCISLCHSESAEHQALLRDVTNSDWLAMKYGWKYPVVQRALKKIAENHEFRIVHFGRFPERNAALSRLSTQRERSYLDELY